MMMMMMTPALFKPQAPEDKEDRIMAYKNWLARKMTGNGAFL